MAMRIRVLYCHSHARVVRRLELERTSAEESLAHARDQSRKLEEMYHKLLADRESTPRHTGPCAVTSLESTEQHNINKLRDFVATYKTVHC